VPPRKRSRQKSASSKATGRGKSREFIRAVDEIKKLSRDLDVDLHELRRKIDCLCHGPVPPRSVGGELIKKAAQFDELSPKLRPKG
jgi:hypothetical protein